MIMSNLSSIIRKIFAKIFKKRPIGKHWQKHFAKKVTHPLSKWVTFLSTDISFCADDRVLPVLQARRIKIICRIIGKGLKNPCFLRRIGLQFFASIKKRKRRAVKARRTVYRIMDFIVLLLLNISLALAAGLILTRLFNLIHLPNVTAYLVAGLLVSPIFALSEKYAGTNVLNSMGTFSQIALGFIAFSIGFSFRFDNLKKLGKKVFVITVVQALFTALSVDCVLFAAYLFGWVSLPIVFVLGAIATATAPAATLLVIKQYGADGPVTQTLLPVVAIDDAIGLMVFSLSFSVSETLAAGTAISFVTVVLEPLKEIVLSVAIGAALGFIVAFAEKLFKSRANRLTIIIICVFTGVALSSWLKLSSLLLCMSIAAVYCNADHHTERVMDTYDKWTHPLYIIFFVVSGAQLDVTKIAAAGVVGALYLVARSVGKYVGAGLGASLTKAEPNVKKYLGLTLLPQAGVALGMAEIVKESEPLAPYAPIITTVVLCATLIYELIGPLITKWALTKAGEIVVPEKPKKETKTNA